MAIGFAVHNELLRQCPVQVRESLVCIILLSPLKNRDLQVGLIYIASCPLDEWGTRGPRYTSATCHLLKNEKQRVGD